VRWYNVLLIAFGLYLSALYLFNIGEPHLEVLKDYKLHLEVVALSLFIMSGYIINAFYDLEKDLINDPKKAIFDRLISKEISFMAYFAFNGIGAFLSLFISWPVFLTNVFFSFALWFYSHKMRKKAMLSEFAASLLTILPFISLSIYYDYTNQTILLFFLFLGTLIFTREVIKKMIALKGDLILGDKSIPIVFGTIKTKRLIITLLIFTSLLVVPVSIVVQSTIVHGFLALVVLSIIVNFYLTTSKGANNYSKMNIIYKALLILALLCVPFLFA
jgi:4-hydroxybenzoate polyprenyltransferase